MKIVSGAGSVQLDGNHTNYYSKPHPPNMPTKPHPPNTSTKPHPSNIGMPCGCGLILMIFPFLLLPKYLPYATIRFARETTNQLEWSNKEV